MKLGYQDIALERQALVSAGDLTKASNTVSSYWWFKEILGWISLLWPRAQSRFYPCWHTSDFSWLLKKLWVKVCEFCVSLQDCARLVWGWPQTFILPKQNFVGNPYLIPGRTSIHICSHILLKFFFLKICYCSLYWLIINTMLNISMILHHNNTSLTQLVMLPVPVHWLPPVRSQSAEYIGQIYR